MSEDFKNQRSALIFANGAVSDREIEKIRNKRFAAVLAADGGAAAALRFGFPPDFVLGDLDSVSGEIRSRLPAAQFVHRPSQELNDLEKALQFCAEKKFTRLTLLGVSGKRLDHTLSNFSVLCRYDQKFELEIYTPYSQVFIVRERFIWNGPRGQLISLAPMGAASGVATEGLAFPLKNEDLVFGRREGLSNYITASPVKISLKSGTLLVFVNYGAPAR